MARRVAIQEKYLLPSGGKIYGNEAYSSEITLRAMSTLEEKIRLSSGSGSSILPELVKACIVSPAEIDTKALKLFDLEFLIYKLRIVTYGPKYKVQVRCSGCGSLLDSEVNLDKLEISKLPDDFTEPFDLMVLPISSDKISCRLLNSYDFQNLNNDVRKTLDKYPDYVGDPSMILEWNYKIETINGEKPKSTLEIQKYVESMHAHDFHCMCDSYADKISNVGLNKNQTIVCPHCGQTTEYALPVNEEFFRPTNYGGK
jgi:hypothetical protein